jgi:hypothetical protein
VRLHACWKKPARIGWRCSIASDIDLNGLSLLTDLQLSTEYEFRLPLLWTAMLAGRIELSLAATTGGRDLGRVVKYMLAGSEVVMTTSALLRHGGRLHGNRARRPRRRLDVVAQL